MKKSLTLLLLLLAVFTITGCEKEGPIVENESPSILGVVDESTIILGESFDALEGVTASDPEDGDVTGEIVVTSIPLLSDVAGVFTPTETGDYYLTYKATDSNGEAVEAYTTLKVMPQVSEKVSFTEFVFTEGTVEFDGYEVAIGETAVGTFEASKGVLSIDLTANGDADWHAQLAKTGIEIAKGNTYEFIIRMKATETVKTHFIINNAEIGWAPYGGQWNMEVGTEFANYTIEFLANDDSANAEFLLQYGGDNFDGFTNPEAFGLVIDSIIIRETPSVISNELHSDDFSTTDKAEFEVGIGETAVGTSSIADGVLEVSLSENGDADWHAKIFKTNIQIEAGSTYTFTVNMKASETVKLAYIINNAEAGWAPYIGNWNMEIGTEFADYTLEFIANEDSTNAEFLLQFGGDNFDGFTNPAAWDLTVDSITIVKSIPATEETVVIEDNFDDGNTDGWAERGEESHVASITNADDQLVFQVDAYPVDNNPWEMDLYLATDFDLVNGNTYKLVFDYDTVNDQFYELCFEDMNMDWQIRAGFKNGTLTGSGTLEYTFVSSMDITDLYIKLSVGKGAEGVDTNTLKLDNLKLYEISGSTEFVETVTEFSPDNETTPWGTFNNNDEGAFGVVYAEEGNLIYEVEAFGNTDWFNKLYFENVDLTTGGLYTIEFTVSADNNVEGLFFLNPTGQWDPRISESILVTGTEQTFSFTMNDKLLFDMNYELLFQFGFPTNTAPTRIEFTNVTIYRQD